MITQTPTAISLGQIFQEIDMICAIIDKYLNQNNREVVFGPELTSLFARNGDRPVPPQAVLKLALFNDCLRVACMALMADGELKSTDLDEAFDFVYPLSRHYARFVKEYKAFDRFDGSVDEFLRHHRANENPLGYACAATQWLGFDICRRVKELSGDPEALELYRVMVLRLMDELIGINGITPAERRARDQLEAFLALEERIKSASAEEEVAGDRRLRGFCDGNGPNIFAGVAQASSVWERDPLDVKAIHAEARGVFERVINRLTTPDVSSLGGRMLLIRGESGSGKTHLLRAFRSHVHGRQLGYAGYLQFPRNVTAYERHTLDRLIDSLERPYDPPDITESGLLLLSDALVERGNDISLEDRERLQNGSFTPAELAEFVGELSDRIVSTPGYEEFDPDLIRAFLYLQRRDPPTHQRVLKYLRCEDLGSRDRWLLGDMPPRRHELALKTISELGLLIRIAHRGVLVLLVDQLEDLTGLTDAHARFRHVVSVFRHITDHLPNSLVVLACIDDKYSDLRSGLTQSERDRIERDPAPVVLSDLRTMEEIEALVARRLRYLYESLDMRYREDDPLFPFRRDQLAPYSNLRTRDILDACHSYREQCIKAGALVDFPPVGGPVENDDTIELVDRRWNEFRSEHPGQAPEEDSAQVELLAWAIGELALELPEGWGVHIQPEETMLEVNITSDEPIDSMLVALCNQNTRGPWLGRKIEEAVRRAGEARRTVIARSGSFPKGPKGQVIELMGAIAKQGGRCVRIGDAEWRELDALRAFIRANIQELEVATWRRQIQPLTQSRALRELLGLEELLVIASRKQAEKKAGNSSQTEPPIVATPQRPEPAKQAEQDPISPTPPEPRLPQPASGTNSIHIGRTPGLGGTPVTMSAEELKRHIAVLGSTGSGKTTLALRIVEQLLAQRVPVILLDRKGDLCAYGRSSWWNQEPVNVEDTAAKRALARSVSVRVYTPGNPRGCPLGLSVVPQGMAEVEPMERHSLARQAAAALAGMMDYRSNNDGDRQRTSVLSKAIELLAELRGNEPITLKHLVELIDNEDPALLVELSRFQRHFSKLCEHLVMLNMNHPELLDPKSHPLDIDELFGRGSFADGKTRLSVISTKFLGARSTLEFWVTRFLLDIGRWADRNPSGTLQGVLLLDEADLYMPAIREPATKEPLMDLLRRARSKGIGIILATQSPGDLDYKGRENIETWMVGKIAAETAMNKIKPLFGSRWPSASKRLPTQKVGEFYVVRSNDTSQIRAERSLMETEQLSDEEILALAKR